MVDVFRFAEGVSRASTVPAVSAAIAEGLVDLLGAVEAAVYVADVESRDLHLTGWHAACADCDDPAQASVYAEALGGGDGLLGVLVIELSEPLTAAGRDALSAAAGPAAAFLEWARARGGAVPRGSAPAGRPPELRDVQTPLSLYCQLMRTILRRGMPRALEMLDDMERALTRRGGPERAARPATSPPARAAEMPS